MNKKLSVALTAALTVSLVGNAYLGWQLTATHASLAVVAGQAETAQQTASDQQTQIADLATKLSEIESDAQVVSLHMAAAAAELETTKAKLAIYENSAAAEAEAKAKAIVVERQEKDAQRKKDAAAAKEKEEAAGSSSESGGSGGSGGGGGGNQGDRKSEPAGGWQANSEVSRVVATGLISSIGDWNAAKGGWEYVDYTGVAGIVTPGGYVMAGY